MQEYPLHVAAVAAYCKIPPARAALMDLLAPTLEANAGRVGFPSALDENHVHSRNIIAEPLGLGSEWRWNRGARGKAVYVPLPPEDCYFTQEEGGPDRRGPVFLCEGETAGITLAGLGYFTIASTSSEWPEDLVGDYVKGRKVVLWRDNDPNGSKWEAQAAAWAGTYTEDLWRVVPNEHFEERDDARDIWIRHPWREADFHHFVFERIEAMREIIWREPHRSVPAGRRDNSDIYAAASSFEDYAHRLGSDYAKGGRYRCWNTAGHHGGDRTPSGSYGPSSGGDGNTLWRCHGCGKAGDIVTIAAEADGMDTREWMRRKRKELGASGGGIWS